MQKQAEASAEYISNAWEFCRSLESKNAKCKHFQKLLHKLLDQDDKDTQKDAPKDKTTF